MASISHPGDPASSAVAQPTREATALYETMQRQAYERTDRLFGMLMVLQWAAGIGLALIMAPTTGAGASAAPHLHVYAAILLGGLVSLGPAALAYARPGRTYTRYAIAAGQALWSALLIHLTGGHIETHFHIFASLGILAFYRDWKVLVIAAGVIAIDHLIRGLLYPQSLFGLPTADLWRVLEHTWWVVFMITFLIKISTDAVNEQREMAMQQATIRAMNAANEALLHRTEAQRAQLDDQRADLEQALTSLDAQQRDLRTNVELMLRQMDAFAAGDLSVRLPTNRKGEVGRLFAGFNKAIENMHHTLHQVNQAVEQTASAAAQISGSAEELAAGSQQQSAQSYEVATAVEEMARTIGENAQNASRTAAVATENGHLAEEGSEVVGRTVHKIRQIADVVRSSSETIERLGASSKQIGAIISVIDEIADQTNLLALNAAIEAARAGNQGRGFAVVADEVRKLAERTTSATRQIAGMIRTIQADTEAAVQAMQQGNAEVEEGIHLADRAGAALRHIVSGVQEAVEVATQIAAASEEQSTTSEEIARSVEAISAVSSESATGIEHIARGADDLSRQTRLLRQLVSQFHLAVAPASGPPSPSRAAPEV